MAAGGGDKALSSLTFIGHTTAGRGRSGRSVETDQPFADSALGVSHDHAYAEDPLKLAADAAPWHDFHDEQKTGQTARSGWSLLKSAVALSTSAGDAMFG